MYPGSSHESESDYASQDGGFVKSASKKRGRKPKASSQPTPTTPTQEAKRIALGERTTNPTDNTVAVAHATKTSNQKTLNHNPVFTHTFILNTVPATTRVQLAIRWEELNPKKDIIIRQENYFLVKTNDNDRATETLQQLKQNNIITTFKLHKTNNLSTLQQHKTSRHITPSYSDRLSYRRDVLKTVGKTGVKN